MMHDDDAKVDQSLLQAMSELIVLVQEAKQALFAGPRGAAHDRVDELLSWLLDQIDAIDEAETRRFGRPGDFLYPSGRKRPNIMSSAVDRPEAIFTLLAAHIGAVATDLRRAAASIGDSEEATLFDNVADDLERRRSELVVDT